MKVFLISVFKILLQAIYAPMKLRKTKNEIVYLSRQSNEKSMDMQLLEAELLSQCPDAKQIFRLKMIDEGISEKLRYFFHILGDMWYLSTAKVAILDTYSIAVSCLSHKQELRVIQMWHALGAVKKFGLQSLGTEEGRDKKISTAMCMHKNYNFVLAPSAAAAKFYMEAFGCTSNKIKICSLPRVDYIVSSGDGKTREFYLKNPGMTDKKIILYLPTFREREAYVAQKLKVEFEDADDYQLIIKTHPLSKVKKDNQYTFFGDFDTYDLMKVADIIITDYSACAIEASLLMKPLYFFVPDYDAYVRERGLNMDLKAEMGGAVFEDATELKCAVTGGNYDCDLLYAFKSKYIENIKPNNAMILAKFICSELYSL